MPHTRKTRQHKQRYNANAAKRVIFPIATLGIYNIRGDLCSFSA